MGDDRGDAAWQGHEVEEQHRLAVGRALLGQVAILRDRQPQTALALTVKAFEHAAAVPAATLPRTSAGC